VIRIRWAAASIAVCRSVACVGRRVKEVRVEDQPTCGKGLAENAVVTGTLGAVATAMADVLERQAAQDEEMLAQMRRVGRGVTI
jgi:hypothetical protein